LHKNLENYRASQEARFFIRKEETMASQEEVEFCDYIYASRGELRRWGDHGMEPTMASNAAIREGVAARMGGDIGAVTLEGFDRTGLPAMAASMAITAERTNLLTQQ
jgi:hypothetical protein